MPYILKSTTLQHQSIRGKWSPLSLPYCLYSAQAFTLSVAVLLNSVCNTYFLNVSVFPSTDPSMLNPSAGPQTLLSKFLFSIESGVSS